MADNDMQVAPQFPSYPCCAGADAIFGEGWCMCHPAERALRYISTGCGEPMTSVQRDWCKREILSVEGYDHVDESMSDADLASMVLHAWQDYCRNLGML